MMKREKKKKISIETHITSETRMKTFHHPPNAVEPRRQLAMKQENTFPNGIAAPAPNFDALIAAIRAGGHCNTKMYIAPNIQVQAFKK
jgi:hypothetical protein